MDNVLERAEEAQLLVVLILILMRTTNFFTH